MQPEIALLEERLVADVAFVLLVPGVRKDVHHQVALLPKRLVADLADVGFGTAVCEMVLAEDILGGEYSATFLAEMLVLF